MIYLTLYAAVMCLLVLLREWGQRSTLDRFLVADRRVGGVVGAMSIAASWIWAPAIFVSTRIGYEWGYSGLLWFIVPNMLSLIIFAPVAVMVRKRLPLGYSYIEAVTDKGGGFWQTQLTVQLLMQIVIFSIQLTAGAELLSAVTGATYDYLVVGMGLTPFVYTFFSGLRTSVFTDAIQYAVIAGAAVLLLVFFPAPLGTPDVRPFHPLDPTLLVQFGISSALGLLVAIFADHQQWQRAFAIKPDRVLQTYWLGGVLHGVVTLCLGTVGCLIFRMQYRSSAPLELIGINFVRENYSAVFAAIYIVMALCALISTLDSGLCAFSSLAITRGRKNPETLQKGRRFMFLLALLGMLVATFHLPLITLWFLAGTIRLSSFAPTVLSIVATRYSGRVGTISILLGIVVGGSVFAAGIMSKSSELRTLGMFLSLSISAFTSLLGNSRLFRSSVLTAVHTLRRLWPCQPAVCWRRNQ